MSCNKFSARIALLAVSLGSAIALGGCGFLGAIGDSLFGDSSEPPSASGTAQASASSGESRELSRSGQAEGTASPVAAAETSNNGSIDTTLGSGTTAESAATSIPGIEVTWKVPDSASPAFVIYFGSSPDQLSSRVEVATARLETSEDSDQGPVYRYVVSDVPPNGPLYVAVASFDGVSEGARSETLAVSSQ